MSCQPGNTGEILLQRVAEHAIDHLDICILVINPAARARDPAIGVLEEPHRVIIHRGEGDIQTVRAAGVTRQGHAERVRWNRLDLSIYDLRTNF